MEKIKRTSDMNDFTEWFLLHAISAEPTIREAYLERAQQDRENWNLRLEIDGVEVSVGPVFKRLEKEFERQLEEKALMLSRVKYNDKMAEVYELVDEFAKHMKEKFPELAGEIRI